MSLESHIEPVRELLGEPASEARDAALTDAASALRDSDAERGALYAWATLRSSSDVVARRVLSFLMTEPGPAALPWLPLLDLISPPYPDDPATLSNCHTALRRARWTSAEPLRRVAHELPGFLLHCLDAGPMIQDTASAFIAELIDRDDDLEIFTMDEIEAIVAALSAARAAASDATLDAETIDFIVSSAETRAYSAQRALQLDELAAAGDRLAALSARGLPRSAKQLLEVAAGFVREAQSVEALRLQARTRKRPIQELWLRARDAGAIEFQQLADIGRCFIELFQATERDLAGARRSQPIGLVPIGARPGSFVLQLEVGRAGESTDRAFVALVALLARARRREPVASAFDAPGPGLIELAQLLRLLRTNGLQLDVHMYQSSGPRTHQHLTLGRAEADALLPALRPLEYRRLASAEIPQADTLGKVFALLSYLAEDVEISAATMNITPRQIAYYKQAARILGFLNRENGLTPAGDQVVRLADQPDEQLIATVAHFEGSRCGRAWIRWSGGDDLADIDPDSAEPFLRAVVPTLNPVTARRRAQTLQAWHRELIPFHVRG
ncbi:MAG: hypothetical protein Tsb0020_53140 [Haliangiales bacterium]